MNTLPTREHQEVLECSYLNVIESEPRPPLIRRVPSAVGLQELHELRAELTRLRRQISGLETAMNMLNFGIVFVGDGNEVLLTNTQADRHLKSGKGLRLSSGRLTPAKSADQQALQSLLGSAARSSRAARGNAGGCMQISGACGRPLYITVAPLRSCGVSSHAAAVVFISDPQERTQLPADMLRRCYGLTSAESRLVMLLVEGKSLQEAAASQSTSLNTAKAHLKNVFAKTGVRRQTELMRLLLVSGGFTCS